MSHFVLFSFSFSFLPSFHLVPFCFNPAFTAEAGERYNKLQHWLKKMGRTIASIPRMISTQKECRQLTETMLFLHQEFVQLKLDVLQD